jgi:hypothetical protein
VHDFLDSYKQPEGRRFGMRAGDSVCTCQIGRSTPPQLKSTAIASSGSDVDDSRSKEESGHSRDCAFEIDHAQPHEPVIEPLL